MSKICRHKGHEYHNMPDYNELTFKCIHCGLCMKIDHLDHIYEYANPKKSIMWRECNNFSVPSCAEIKMEDALE